MNGQVDEDEKKDRLAALQSLLNDQQKAFNAGCVGTIQEVLLNARGRHPGQLIGRSPFMQAVHLLAPEVLIGTVANVRIDNVHANSLAASLIEPSDWDKGRGERLAL